MTAGWNEIASSPLPNTESRPQQLHMSKRPKEPHKQRKQAPMGKGGIEVREKKRLENP
jgi:hypothetical protein